MATLTNHSNRRTKLPKGPNITVKIDEQMIEDAVPKDSSHCMIAEAVKKAYPGALRVAVDLQTIRFTDTNRPLRYTYLTPRVAQLALCQFDQGIKPVPFSFLLRGAQVTVSSSMTGKSFKARVQDLKKGELSEGQKASLLKARQAWGEVLSRQKLRSSDNGKVSDRVGGKPPPTTPFARRRAFGLRALNL